MRLGIVGCGDAAFAVSLASRFVRGISIAAVSDLDAARRERLARRHRARTADSWEELLDPTSLDAVYLAVPHDLHRRMAVAFARAGIAVLLEKPVAADLSDANGLVREAPSGAQIAVNYQYRVEPRVRELVRASREGGVGRIAYIQVLVPWYRDARYFSGAGWHASRARSGGGTLLTQGSHLLDVALTIAGDPVRVTARVFTRVHETEVEDLAAGIVETRSGAPVIITSSMVSRPGEPASITVYGDRGSIRYQGPGRSRLTGRGVRVRRPIVLTELHAYAASLARFRDWVSGAGEPACTLSEAMRVMRCVSALYESAAGDRTVGLV